jgi:hypothetical protein
VGVLLRDLLWPAVWFAQQKKQVSYICYPIMIVNCMIVYCWQHRA